MCSMHLMLMKPIRMLEFQAQLFSLLVKINKNISYKENFSFFFFRKEKFIMFISYQKSTRKVSAQE